MADPDALATIQEAEAMVRRRLDQQQEACVTPPAHRQESNEEPVPITNTFVWSVRAITLADSPMDSPHPTPHLF